MAGLETGCDRSTRIATGIHDVSSVMVLCLIEESFDTRLDETPSTCIERFFLTPHNGLCVLVSVKVLLELLPREWVELFNASNRGVLDALIGAVLGQRGVDLTGTDYDTVDLIWLGDAFAVFWIRDNPLEVRLASEVLEV